MLFVIIYLRDMKDFEVMNFVWDVWVEKGFEFVRVCVEVRFVREYLLVEMSVVVVIK